MAEVEGLVSHSMIETMISRAGRPARREPVRARTGEDQADVPLGVPPGIRPAIRLGVQLCGAHGVDARNFEVCRR